MRSFSYFPRVISISSIFISVCWGQTNSTDYPNCPQPNANCAAYGVDFQGGGTYFQNTGSTEAFDFTSQYDQCQNDIAQNILVDPAGDEYLCSTTRMQPFNVNAKSTCPKQKAAMFDGGWAMLIISNNGQCAPVAFERDVIISAGPQQTTTYTPTVVFTSTSTIQKNITTTTTLTSTVTAKPPYTITSPASYATRVSTVTPAPIRTTTTLAITKTIIRWKLTVVPTIKTLTATCKPSRPATNPDPKATYNPSLVVAEALQTGDAEPAQVTDAAITARAVPFDKETRLIERKARLKRFAGLEKRAPDLATLTVTDNDPAHFSTSTTIVYTTMTNFFETAKTITTTVTPPPATVYSGVSTVPVRTTLPPRTIIRTRTLYAFTTVTSTITLHPTIYSTVTPSGAVASCTKAVGRLTT